MQSIQYAWRIRDVRMQHGRKKKWRTLNWKMTETQALAWASRHGFELQRVEGSAEAQPVSFVRPLGPAVAPAQADDTSFWAVR
jgi:hypothetical protein